MFIYKSIYLLFNENNSDINNKRRCFSVFTRQRSWIAFFVQGGPPLGRLAGKKSSSLRSGIFFRQALPQKTANPRNGRLENREKASRWDYSFQIFKEYETANHHPFRQTGSGRIPVPWNCPALQQRHRPGLYHRLPAYGGKHDQTAGRHLFTGNDCITP